MRNRKQKTNQKIRRTCNAKYQPLEPRQLLATISLTAGELLLGGDTSDDVASVSISGSTVTASITGADSQTFAASDVSSILFVGLAGNDRFTNSTSIPSVAFGQAGNDTLIGGSGNDRLLGGPGNDVFEGNEGDDEIRGGGGDMNTIIGGPGNDRLFGGVGDNEIDAGEGDDLVHGGSGIDSILGREGNDELYPGDGDDIVRGGDGDDSVNSGSGADMVFGDAGNDLIFLGAGIDSAEGGDGDDNINGGDDDDTLIGGNGSDRLTGANGNDNISGGAGVDKINGGFGDDTIDGGSAPEGFGDLYFVSSIEANYRVYDSLSVRDIFGEGGTDNLTNVDWLHFNDENYAAKSQVERFVRVQPIIVSNTNGTNRADFFGDASSESEIKELVNDIVYKDDAKLQINWLSNRSWGNTNANTGVYDIIGLMDNAPSGIVQSPETIIYAFIVENVKGISSTSEDTAFGVSLVGDSGVSLRVGTNLLTFDEGRRSVARVAAHEIAHNLGLVHNSAPANLMFGGSITGDNLNSSQQTTIRGSKFSSSV